MGDINRAVIVADYVASRFAPCRVLDVAGGGGYLSLELARRGFSPVLVDPRHTGMRRKTRKANGALMSLITRLQQPFDAAMAKDAELVVALHPDGATEQAARAVEFAPSLVIPCCNYWPGHDGPVENAVRRVMMDLGAVSEVDLPMKGKNLLLEGRS